MDSAEVTYQADKCVFSFCQKEPGVGTWTQIGEYDRNVVLPVCEEHWQALRTVR